MTAMQIRLTVLGPRSGPTTRACDVLVTAPAGTALATVAGSLAAAVAGSGADVGTGGSSAPSCSTPAPNGSTRSARRSASRR
ncbi:hypothetical protein O1L44_21265 [Streptomyces noursei]|nr:hypothetical protein [Streptomyces noursei]